MLFRSLEGKDPKDPANRRISIVVVSAATEKAETKHQKAQPREKDKVKSEAKPKADEHSAHH